MEEKDKLRQEYREKVGSVYCFTWEWYAEWLEKELLKERCEVEKRKDLLKPMPLNCPFCDSKDTQVIDSESDCDCNSCGKAFKA